MSSGSKFPGETKVMGRKKELIYPVGNKGRQWNESPFHWVLLVTEIQGTREPQELTTSSNLGGERVGKGWNCYLDHFEPPVGMVIKGNLWVEQFGDKCWLRCPSQECTPTAFLPGPGRLYPSVPSCRAICWFWAQGYLGVHSHGVSIFSPICPLPSPLVLFLMCAPGVCSWFPRQLLCSLRLRFHLTFF